MEQIACQLFGRRLDGAHTLDERKALQLKRPLQNRAFPAGKNEKGASPRAPAPVALQEPRAG